VRRWVCRLLSCVVVASNLLRAAERPTTRPVITPPRADGYRGIWWGQEPTGDAYNFKYSGGLGTYTAKHTPLAIYSKAVNKTFFVYGGSTGTGKNELVAMISYFDHGTGTVPRPVMVHEKRVTSDPHDNPALSLDEHGHLWVFVSGRARQRPGFIYRGVRPYSIDSFERIEEGELTYPQPWYFDGHGFVFLFTKYLGGRQLFWRTSPDGVHWSEDQPLARFGGHYQISRSDGRRLATAFNWHPGGNVDRRTNIYYLETLDYGKTWQNVRGETVRTPLTEVRNPALVHDYQAEGRLAYIKDVNFDPEGRPVILYIESRGAAPGPANGLRLWKTARWNGNGWDRRPITTSDHNYDTGSLYIEGELWRVIAPTEPGPQPWHTGGEMTLWESRDRGNTWTKVRDITSGSRLNHTYARRPVNAHPEFYAFWADGDPSQRSESRLYFTNHDGDRVYVLPYRMDSETARPERVR